jgi:hypothetical protein
VVLMMSESPGSVMASTLTRNSLPQAVPRSTLSAGQQQRQQETHKHWYMTQGGNSNSLPGWKHVYLEFNISLTLRGRKLQQLYCSKHTAASILQQAYCSKHTAASILQQAYCSKHTAARILQQGYCSKDTAELSCVQMCAETTSFGRTRGHASGMYHAAVCRLAPGSFLAVTD